MSLTLRTTPYGRPAALALRAAIAAAKGDDGLAPVTVVVTRGAVALATRRLLSSTQLGPPAGGGTGGSTGGVLNVRFVTLSRLVHELGGPGLEAAGRRPLTDAVLTAAAIDVVRSHPAGVDGDAPAVSTARALCSTWREFRGVPGVARRRLAAQSRRANGALGLIDALTERLGAWYDDADAAREAARLVAQRGPTVLEATGPLIWYLPSMPPPWASALVRTLAGHAAVIVLVGMTGEPAADEPAQRLQTALGQRAGRDAGDDVSAALAAAPPRPAIEVVSASAADAEIFVAVRGVMARLEAGVPAERIALVDGGSSPYRRQIRETLTVAGVPFHGNAVRALSATVPGRTLLGLFEIAERGWRRDDVVAWMSAAPLRDAEGPIPATRWDLVTRAAGVTSGLDGWRSRLHEHEVLLRGRLDDAATEAGAEDGDGPAGETDVAVEGHRRRLAETERLRRFVEHLVAVLEGVPRTWAAWSRWCLETLDDLLGGAATHRAWPEVEVLARDALREAMVSLAALDRLAASDGPVPVDTTTFRAAAATELDAPAPDVSRTGRGVMIGHVDELVGLEMDTVFIVGMVDGAYPHAGRDDPLIPDRERALAGDELPLRTRRQAEARRRYLAALAGAGTVVLSFARGDQRDGREQRPARWLLDALQANLGGIGRVYARDLSTLEPFPGYRVVESFTAAVTGDGTPLSLADADVRSLISWRAAGGRAREHALARHDETLSRGLTAQAARRSGRFTRFDGLVADAHLPSPTETVQSPTGLEKYGSCPRSYFLQRVLRLRTHDRPERVVRIDPAVRGVVVHRILERFVSAALIEGDGAARPAGAPYTDPDRAELERIANDELAEAERRGLTGLSALWKLDRASILRDVARFADEDTALRVRFSSTPVAVERSFGPPHARRDGRGAGSHRCGDEEAGVVAVPVPGGRVQFRGTIDRIDRTDSGGTVVIDYKTGTAFELREIEADAARGRRLQLPVYALAASDGRPPTPSSPVRSLYWYVSERGRFERAELEFDAAAYERLSSVVGAMVDGIAAGVFPANPGPRENGEGSAAAYRNCRFCDFDALCPRERSSEWSRKHGDPAMDPYTRWAEE